LQNRNLNILWGCQTKTHLIDQELMDTMKSSGCIQLDFGIESGSDRILDVINKKTSVINYLSASKICRESGVRQLANMMINVPTETLLDIEMSIDLIKKAKYNVILWNVYTPFPGVAFGREMDIEDLEIVRDESDVSLFNLLEEKYKFGKYEVKITDILERVWKIFPNPRHPRATLNIFYYLKWFRYFSYLFMGKYLLKIIRSRKKASYVRGLFRAPEQKRMG